MKNDRFKFRVWNKKNSEYVPEGEMCDVHCLLHRDGTLDCGIAYDDGYAGGIDWVKTEDAIIEQCTGLKDKNGKLIYEGDVVKQVFKDGSSMYREVYYDSVMCRWYLRRCSPGLHSTRQYLFWDFNSSAADKLEIIGNIHERESKNE